MEKADAKRDLDELIAPRAQSIDPGLRHTKLATFGEVVQAWFRAGCPSVAPTSKSRHARLKSPREPDLVKVADLAGHVDTRTTQLRRWIPAVVDHMNLTLTLNPG